MVAIEVSGLRKVHADVAAVDGLDLQVGTGEVGALLRPKGAGSHRRRDPGGPLVPRRGEVHVLGVDPQQAGRRWRERTGVVLQEAGFVENSKRELLRLHAGCYPRPPPVAEVIALTGLDEKAGSKVKTLSGDQRWRFNLALALGI